MVRYVEIGQNIKQYRSRKKMPQDELAFLADTSTGYISNLELNKGNPTIEKLGKIAESLGVTLLDLLQKDAAEKPPPQQTELSEFEPAFARLGSGDQQTVRKTLTTLMLCMANRAKAFNKEE